MAAQRQRPGVRGRPGSSLDEGGGSRKCLHQARITVGEWPCREFPRKPASGVPGPGAVLQHEGSERDAGGLAASLQPRAAARQSAEQASGPEIHDCKINPNNENRPAKLSLIDVLRLGPGHLVCGTLTVAA